MPTSIRAWFAAVSVFIGFAAIAVRGHAALPERYPLAHQGGQSGAIVSESPFTLPSKEEQAALIQETMTTFVRAVARRDMGELYAEAAAVVREQMSPEQLLLSFRPFLPIASSLTPVALRRPIVTGAVASSGEGALSIEGYYALDQSAVTFRAVYVREGLVWRWSNLHVKVLPSESKPGT